MHYQMTPRVAFLACSILIFLLESPSPNAAAAEEVAKGNNNAGIRLTRAKRQLVGTPNIPLMDPKRKRPFCNAFTGCGKKRSEGPLRMAPVNNNGELPEVDMGDVTADSESMATLVELNSEPAVAELSRQILSEAKLWEAIQEARQELSRRREQQASLELQNQRVSDRQPRGRPSQFELTGIRKRRNAPPPIPKGTLPSAGNGALPIV